MPGSHDLEAHLQAPTCSSLDLGQARDLCESLVLSIYLSLFVSLSLSHSLSLSLSLSLPLFIFYSSPLTLFFTPPPLILFLAIYVSVCLSLCLSVSLSLSRSLSLSLALSHLGVSYQRFDSRNNCFYLAVCGLRLQESLYYKLMRPPPPLFLTLH